MTTSIADLRARAFKEQEARCFYCNFPIWNDDSNGFARRYCMRDRQARQFRCTAEHLVARQDGGRNSRSNVVAACHLCNRRRHARRNVWKRADEYLAGGGASLHPLFCMAYDAAMNLIESNPHLRSSAKRRKLIHQWVKESSAVEGIHHPFSKGKRTFWPKTMDELVTYWTERVAAQSRARRESRAARTRGSVQRG